MRISASNGLLTGDARRLVIVTPASVVDSGLEAELSITGIGEPPAGAGDAVQLFNPTAGQRIEIRVGTAATPDVSLNPPVKVVRTVQQVQGAIGGDGAEQMAAIIGISLGTSTNVGQVTGVVGGAQSSSTNPGGQSGGGDACAIYGVGRITGAGVGTGIGGFLAGRRDTNTGKANALELSAQNYTATPGTYNTAGFSTTTGLWIEATGNSDSGVAIAIGNPFGFQYDVGIGIPAQVNNAKTGGVKTSSFRDDGQAATSLDIRGTHATAAINVAAGAGPILIGSGNNIGVFGHAAAGQQTVTGSRGGNAALASFLTAMAATGWITDSSTA